MDDHQDTLVNLRGDKYKSYLENVVPSFTLATQHVANAFSNMRRFLNHDLNMAGSLRTLIREFYRSIETDTPPPIPYREILLTARLMDEIFAQLSAPRRRRLDDAGMRSTTAVELIKSV